MYTLEDDQETSARLRKDDLKQADHTTGASPTGQQHAPLTQISSSLKQITTPGKAHVADRRVALAALTIACIGVFFTALDQTVVVTALPQIVNDLQIPITQLAHASWIVSAYLLGFIIMMPLMGRVSDIYGRRRIFLLCLTIFGIGSIACGLAPLLGQLWDLGFLSVFNIDTSTPGQVALTWLIAARLFQAIGGGAIVPVAMAIAGDFYGAERRSLALGIIGGITEAGGALGPLYGAIIVQHLGWQFIFYLNVPIVIGLMIAAWFLIPRGTRLREAIDWIGAITLGLALTCLSLGLAQEGTELGPAVTGTSPQNNPISLALAAVFLIAFVLVERKVRFPVVDLKLFKRLPFSATSLVSLFVGAALIIAMADIPIYVDTVLQRPVIDSGLALLRLTAMIPVGALLGGWLCGHISCRLTGVLGLLFTAVGFYLMSLWPVQVDWTQMTISTLTAGLGFGLVIAPIGTTAINAVKSTQAGMSSAVVTALRMVGMMLGLAALTSWALAYFKQLASTYPSLPITATSAQFAQWSRGYAHHLIISAHTVYSAVFFTAMILCLLAIIPAIFLWGRRPPEAEVAPVGRVALDDTLLAAVAPDPAAVTVPVGVEHDAMLPATMLGLPPTPPGPGASGQGPRGWRNPKRRRIIIAAASLALIAVLVFAGTFAALNWQSDPNATMAGTNPAAASAPVGSGPRMIQLGLDGTALTSIITQQLGLKQGTLTDMKIGLAPNDGLSLSLNLHIDANGIHRVMPIEMDGALSLDKQQNLQLQVQHVKRDGRDAGSAVAAQTQSAVTQLMQASVMPALHGQLKNARLISVHTSTALGCSKGQLMLVLLIQAPPIQGIAAQPTPSALCFSGPINKLLP
ncbi:MAG: MFS transporter [Ktedonobacteraceae bacterium]|nr:MFS transporter [Ktedonobacteraceae bacterium]